MSTEPLSPERQTSLERSDAAPRGAVRGDGLTVPLSSEAAPSAALKLEGRMGVPELVFTVLAFNGPLAAVAGYLAFVIYFNGIGAPLMLAIAGVINLVFAVGFTAMSRYMPNPGAFYSYITAGLGRVLGLGGAFLAVFAYALVVLGVYAFFGIISNQLVSNTFSGPHIAWYWYSLVAWIVITALSYRNIAASARTLLVALAVELVTVLVFDAAVLINGGPQGRSLEPFNPTVAFQNNIGAALLFSVGLFLGFEATAIFREEVKRPLKTVPRATYTAVLVIGVLYVLSSWLLITAYGVDNAAKVAQTSPADMFIKAVGRYIGTVGVDIVSVLLITSTFAALLSTSNVLSRYLFSLGKDGVLPGFLGHVHPRHASPHKAALVVGGAMLIGGIILIVSGADPGIAYGSLAGVGGFAIIVLETITSVAVLAFFRRAGRITGVSTWQTIIAPVVATLGLGLVVYLAITNFSTLIGGSEVLAIIFQIVTWGVLLAGVVLALIYRKTRPAAYRRIGRQDI